MSPTDAASIITDSLLASLRLASDRGELTRDNLAKIARAAGNNAAMSLEWGEDEP